MFAVILLVFGLGGIVHMALVGAVGVPWFVPDLLMVVGASALASDRSRASWVLAAMGCAAVAGAGEHIGWSIAAYVGSGLWFMRLGAQWDLGERLVRMAAVGVAESLVVTLWLILDGGAGMRLVGYAALKVLITIAAVPCGDRLFLRFLRRDAPV